MTVCIYNYACVCVCVCEQSHVCEGEERVEERVGARRKFEVSRPNPAWYYSTKAVCVTNTINIISALSICFTTRIIFRIYHPAFQDGTRAIPNKLLIIWTFSSKI